MPRAVFAPHSEKQSTLGFRVGMRQHKNHTHPTSRTCGTIGWYQMSRGFLSRHWKTLYRQSQVDEHLVQWLDNAVEGSGSTLTGSDADHFPSEGPKIIASFLATAKPYPTRYDTDHGVGYFEEIQSSCGTKRRPHTYSRIDGWCYRTSRFKPKTVLAKISPFLFSVPLFCTTLLIRSFICIQGPISCT